MHNITEERVSRKEYLKRKNKEKRIEKLKGLKPSTWLFVFIVLILGIYVTYQFYVYNTKHRLIQTRPDEISSLKEYEIFYVSESYTKDGPNLLKYMSTSSNDKTTVDEGNGINRIWTKNDSIYGIKDGNLVKITLGKKNVVDILHEGNVQNYTIYDDTIYVYLKGENIETGVYKINDKKETQKIIAGDIIQMLVDKNNIYTVTSDFNVIKHNKNGEEAKKLTNGEAATYIIQDKQKIYFVNKNDDCKIYYINKENGKVNKILKETATLSSDNPLYLSGSQYFGAYGDYIYYVNTKDNNYLYKAKIDGSEEKKVLNDKIQILDMVSGTIFYKITDDLGVYRYDIESGVSSQITSGKVVEFRVEI